MQGLLFFSFPDGNSVFPLAQESFRRDEQDDDRLDYLDHLGWHIGEQVQHLAPDPQVGEKEGGRDDQKGMVPPDYSDHDPVPAVARARLPVKPPVYSHDLGHSADTGDEAEDDLREDNCFQDIDSSEPGELLIESGCPDLITRSCMVEKVVNEEGGCQG